MDSTTTPKASVLIITYNHERFIAQAVESALMQETDFDYEIVIGEDCSTDSTREILLKYRDRYPDKIRLLLHEKNLGLGGKRNFAATLQACRGQYIALLEGDDYWTAVLKLQRQVDYLESHPECSICFHPVDYVDETGQPVELIPHIALTKELWTIEDLFVTNFIPTMSTMFKARLFLELPDWFYAIRFGDWSLHFLNAEHGKIGMIDEVMAVYRIHDMGAWHAMSSVDRFLDAISLYNYVDRHFNFAYSPTIREMVSKSYFFLSGAYLLERRWTDAFSALLRSLILSPFNRKIPRKKLFLSLCRKVMGKGLPSRSTENGLAL